MIMQTSLQYLVAFKNYNYLNLNVHFSSEQVINIKLRFWRKNNLAYVYIYNIDLP